MTMSEDDDDEKMPRKISEDTADRAFYRDIVRLSLGLIERHSTFVQC